MASDVNWPFHVRKMPYRETDSWYWEVVDRRNGMSTMRRFPTPESARNQADLLNGVAANHPGIDLT
jgi:hypothetical protein